MKFPPIPKTVLITGCSSGIGLSAAEQLKKRDWRVFPTARKESDLQMLREKEFDPIQLDMAQSESVKQAAQKALSLCDLQIGAVVNNAGFGQPGAVEDLTREAMEYQFQVNVFGMQELTNLLIPTFHKQGAGRIVNISSVLGRIVLPFTGIYSASKFAMEALTDALRIELSDTNIATSLIEPGPILTSFRQNSINRVETQMGEITTRFKDHYREILSSTKNEINKPPLFYKTPEYVARKIIHALESPRPRRRYCVTPHAYLGAFMRRFAPYALSDSILSKTLRH